jgi:hypothetical protein
VSGIYPGWLRHQSRISTEVLSIAGIEIPGQDFLEARWVDTNPFAFFRDEWDAVLGLGYDDSSSQFGLKGPLTNMIEQGLLESNVFSLLLGVRMLIMSNWIGIPGELTLGGVNEELIPPNRSMTFLPMTNRIDPPPSDPRFPWLDRQFNSTWQVSAEMVSLTWTNRSSGKNHEKSYMLMHDTVARFESSIPAMILPADIVRDLESRVNLQYLEWFYPVVDCAVSWILPKLTFTLGGEEFTIESETYLLESMTSDNDVKCIWPFIKAPSDWPKDAMVLGNPFMRGFYMTFDRERRSIGLVEPHYPIQDAPGINSVNLTRG